MNQRKKIANFEYLLIALTAIALALMFYVSREGGYVMRAGARITTELGAEAETIVLPERHSVNINTANADELQTLPGVGEAMAQRILEDRKTNGPFWEKEELLRVKGIGDATYAGLEEYITVEPESTGSQTDAKEAAR